MKQHTDIDDLIDEAFAFVALECADAGAFGRDQEGRKITAQAWLGTLPHATDPIRALWELAIDVLRNSPSLARKPIDRRLLFNLQVMRLEAGTLRNEQLAAKELANV